MKLSINIIKKTNMPRAFKNTSLITNYSITILFSIHFETLILHCIKPTVNHIFIEEQHRYLSFSSVYYYLQYSFVLVHL